MPVPDSHGDEIFASFDVDKNSYSKLLRPSECTPNDSTDVFSLLVERPRKGMTENVSRSNVNFLLLLVELLGIR